MLEIDIPGWGTCRLHHLVLDYNGTLAEAGLPVPAARSRLTALAKSLTIHVVTADTFGTAQTHLASWPCQITILPAGDQAAAKAAFVAQLGADGVVAIGNGRNDQQMLAAAAIGIAVVQIEGAAVSAVTAADIITTSITNALDLFLHPLRLRATLRS